MNPDVKAKWVAALRSGEYKQAEGALHRDNAFCCLGVLCDLHRKEVNPDKNWEPAKFDDKFAYLDEHNYPPKEVMDWAGLTQRNPRVVPGRIADLNDRHISFAHIAEIIENTL